jgi:hypothetical protein
MNGRGKYSRRDKNRVEGRFLALPHDVLDAPAFMKLSYPARALLLEIARQYMGANNGQLVASKNYLIPRGWRSSDVITRAKKQLIDAGFIHETVKGQRPNRASWYALTWLALHRHPQYDEGAVASFRQRAYRETAKNAALCPPHGTAKTVAGPYGGINRPLTVPSAGTVRA